MRRWRGATRRAWTVGHAGKTGPNHIADSAQRLYGRAMLPDPLRNLPFYVHTNRELGLMLSGKKPLSSFVDGDGWFPDVMVRYLRLFDRHVVDGRLVRHDHYSETSGKRHHRILFALPNEEWRMQAMIDLMSGLGGWSPDHERREGELLGYEDWMNDHWLKCIYGDQSALIPPSQKSALAEQD